MTLPPLWPYIARKQYNGYVEIYLFHQDHQTCVYSPASPILHPKIDIIMQCARCVQCTLDIDLCGV